MFKKYIDTPAAIAIGLVTIGMFLGLGYLPSRPKPLFPTEELISR